MSVKLETASQSEICGFGKKVMKVVEEDTGNVLAYVTIVEGEPWLHFNRILKRKKIKEILAKLDDYKQ